METGTRLRALVVDDAASERGLLAELLKTLNIEVCEAETGEIAIEQFDRHKPDIVFMDVVMPGMGGIEATRRIKARLDGDFVPIVFLTSLDQGRVMEECIDAGGDDVLSKPYDMRVLRGRLRAMLRIREVYRELHEFHGQMRREEEIAEQVLQSAVTSRNSTVDELETLIRPAGLFSGDVLLCGHAPNGDLHLLLGDFTGHGLAAALGALPASQVFRAMLFKGFSAPDILASINRKLNELLPTGLFMSAVYVVVSYDLSRLSVCNCGMPDCLLLGADRGSLRQRAKAEGVPLGIIHRYPADYTFTDLDARPGDRLLLLSDGLTEASSRAGEAFGEKRLLKLLSQQRSGALLPAITAELDDFCSGAQQADDISVVVLPFRGEVVRSGYEHSRDPLRLRKRPDPGSWETSLTLRGRQLGQSSPVQAMVGQIVELDLLDAERAAHLLGLLSALYNNALDFGVLHLDVDVVDEARAKARREAMHSVDADCWVKVELSLTVTEEHVGLWLALSDSGSGEVSKRLASLALLEQQREACDVIRVSGSGDRVEAECRWPLAD